MPTPNRELSQFSSFISVNDSSKKISIGTTIVNVAADQANINTIESVNANISGILTATKIYGEFEGTVENATNVIGGIASVTSLKVTGISTLNNITGAAANFSGIVTASGFVGNLTGTASTYIETYSNVIGGIASVTSLRVSGISTVGYLTGTTANFSGIVTASSFVGTASSSIISAGLVGSPSISVSNLSASGISTLGSVRISSGIVTATSGVVTYYGDGSKLSNIQGSSVVGSVSNATSSGLATDLSITGTNQLLYQASNTDTQVLSVGSTNQILQSNGASSPPSWVNPTNLSITYAENSGISTNIKGGVAYQIPYQSAPNTTQFISTGISGQLLQYNTGSAPSWVTPTNLSVSYAEYAGYANTSGVSTVAQGLTGNPSISITNINASGISTLGSVRISSGIVTATSGVVTYYGDGSKLTGIIATNNGVAIQNAGSLLGTATTINFSTNLTATFASGIATITATSGGGGGSISISTNTTNTNQLIPYVTSFGSTTGFGATNSFVFNPSTGNLGIGITNPAVKLQVNGIIGFNDSNIRLGGTATAPTITTGGDNFAVGASAGFCLNSGNRNNFLGYFAGRYNTSGSCNNFIGNSAGRSNTTGCYNNFFGHAAGDTNSGSTNNFIGREAGGFNNGGGGNNFIGFCAGRVNSGNNNNFIGNNAGKNNSGADNNFFGTYTGLNNGAGSCNNFMGRDAGRNNSTGSNNIFFGLNAGCNNTTGSFNLIFGACRNTPINNGSNQLVIGAGSTDWINGDSSYNIGIGTNAPSRKLHIQGDIRITGGLYDSNNSVGTAGSVLSSTGSGLSWIAASGGGGGSVSISTDTSNNNELIPYATSFGSTTGLGATNSFVFNPSTGNLGIGTTNPQTKLQVQGVIGFGAGNNVRIGDNTTGSSITSGVSNVLIGPYAGAGITNGSSNNYLGYDAGYGNRGSDNNFFGFRAGKSDNDTSGSCNNFFGKYAGRYGAGCYNNFMGYAAGCLNSGSNNNFFGYRAGGNNTTGDSNNIFGICAGSNNTTGSGNIFIGEAASCFNTTGSNNIFLGSFTGISTTASNKIIIGRGFNAGFYNYCFFDSPNTTKNSQFAIGLRTDANPSKYWLVGDENFNVGIGGTTSPQVKLDVSGAIRPRGVFETVSTATTYLSGSTLVVEVDVQQATSYTYTIPNNTNIGIVSFRNVLSQTGISNATTLTLILTQNTTGTGNTTFATGIGTNVTIVGYENGSAVSGISTRSFIGSGTTVTLSSTGNDVDFVSFFIHYNGGSNISTSSYKVYATKNGNFR